LLAKRCAGTEQVLAVVQHDEQALVDARGHEHVDERTAGLFLDAQRARHRLHDEAGVRDRGQLDEPHAVRIVVEHVRGKLQREPRLADAARADQREQPRAVQRLARLDQFALAADERRGLLRQVVRRRLERAQRGEVAAQRGVLQLVEALGAGEVAQPHEAQVVQRQRLGQPAAHHVDDRLRQQHLPAVRGAHDARRAVERAAEVVVVAALRGADVQAAARPQFNAVSVLRAGERALEVERGLDGVERIGEHSAHPVAGHLEHAALVALHALARDAVVRGERLLHLRRLALPQPAAALDVREQERRDRGRLGHGGVFPAPLRRSIRGAGVAAPARASRP
jgi:hypothetical protein